MNELISNWIEWGWRGKVSHVGYQFICGYTNVHEHNTLGFWFHLTNRCVKLTCGYFINILVNDPIQVLHVWRILVTTEAPALRIKEAIIVATVYQDILAVTAKRRWENDCVRTIPAGMMLSVWNQITTTNVSVNRAGLEKTAMSTWTNASPILA